MMKKRSKSARRSRSIGASLRRAAAAVTRRVSFALRGEGGGGGGGRRRRRKSSSSSRHRSGSFGPVLLGRRRQDEADTDSDTDTDDDYRREGGGLVGRVGAADAEVAYFRAVRRSRRGPRERVRI